MCSMSLCVPHTVNEIVTDIILNITSQADLMLTLLPVFQLGKNRRVLRPSCHPLHPSCPPLRPSALPCALLAPLVPPIEFCSSRAVSRSTIY